MNKLDHLYRFSSQITTTTDPGRLYRTVVRFMQELFELDFATLMLLDDDKQQLTICDTVGFPESMVGTFSLVQGQGLSTHVVQAKAPATVLDFNDESRFEVPLVVTRNNIRSALCVPMMIEDEVFGVLIGHTLRKRVFSSRETTLFRNMGNLAAIAIKNALGMQLLRKSRDEWEMTFNAVPDLIMIIDRGYHATRINRAMAETLAMQSAAAEGRHCYELMTRLGEICLLRQCEEPAAGKGRTAGDRNHDSEPDPAECPVARLFVTGRGDTLERTARNKGVSRTFEITVSPLRDDKGAVIAAIKVMRDITDRMDAEAEHLELERRLLHAQKLESLGVLAGGIAHDFNNLLMAILGNLDVSLMKLSPLSAARPGILAAMNASKRAAELTGQMLAYSGRGLFIVKDLNINELVAENAHLLKAALAKTVTLSLRLGQNIPPVRADASQLQQVIMNLIINASEAVGDRPGAVTLATGVQECDAAYLKTSRLEQRPAPGRFAVLEVTDTGCGMDGQTVQRLFDPFFSTKFTGRGLGMSAVLGIVKGHNGAIMVESEKGKGTTMRVLLPLTETARAEQGRALDANEAGQEPRPARLAGTVMVVDDEEAVRAVCAAMLEDIGCRAITAADGEDALRILRDGREKIDLVLMDLTMPRMDGSAAARAIMRLVPDLKVVLSSGYSEQELSVRFAEQGFAGFIQKPFNLQDLQSVLSRALGSSG